MIHRGDQKPDLSNYNIRIQLPKNMEELSNKVHLISFYVTEGSNLDGFFSFRYDREVIVMEMIHWISSSESACREMLTYLQENYWYFEIWFEFDARDRLLQSLLAEYGAKLSQTTQKMILSKKLHETSVEGVEYLNEKYVDQYIKLRGMNSDATELLEILEENDPSESGTEYIILVAIQDHMVAGCLEMIRIDDDYTLCGLLVDKHYQEQAFASKLLAKARKIAKKGTFSAEINPIEEQTICLLTSLGFTSVDDHVYVNATWHPNRKG